MLDESHLSSQLFVFLCYINSVSIMYNNLVRILLCVSGLASVHASDGKARLRAWVDEKRESYQAKKAEIGAKVEAKRAEVLAQRTPGEADQQQVEMSQCQCVCNGGLLVDVFAFEDLPMKTKCVPPLIAEFMVTDRPLVFRCTEVEQGCPVKGNFPLQMAQEAGNYN